MIVNHFLSSRVTRRNSVWSSNCLSSGEASLIGDKKIAPNRLVFRLPRVQPSPQLVSPRTRFSDISSFNRETLRVQKYLLTLA